MFPGVDIVQIERFQQACQRTPKIRQRLFTQRERAILADKGIKSWAASFAGKEAVLKALGTGLRGISWHDIEIIPNNLGEPEVYLTDKGKELLEARGGTQIRISLSHEKDLAIGMAILF